MKDSVGQIETQIAKFEKLITENGSVISPVEIAYETYGKLSENRDNAILICHALSGDAHAAGFHKNATKPGWWDYYIGPGKAFDTNKYFVISSNVIGGCRGSSGPTTINPATGKQYGSSFPFVSIKDMVNAQHLLMDFFGLNKFFCVSGGSMGGMQALQWAVSYPDKVENCIILATSAEHSAQQISFNEVGRQAIMSDPHWNNGDYNDDPPRKGLALARMIGHITYLSDLLMREKFGRKPPKGNILTADFAVGSYLVYQGESFVDRFDANSYIYVTKALDHFSLGKGMELTSSLSNVKSNFLVIAYSSDWLYPPYQSREIVTSLEVNAIPVSYCEIETTQGHDSFLLANQEQTHLIYHFLNHARNTINGK
ncbi:MAG: homoserine O-acetyltransferase [Leptospiraceae bacterium]|nr:homoserine O-acetyltransferase [Leptospiraceae bacterium]MCK6379631.1 homoserine O-acetyltransferase [Leptospiraceae bacterium]